MALSAAQRQAKLARKAKRRKEQLKAKAKLAASPIDEVHAALVVHAREQMFGEPPDGFYTKEQCAAADAVAAAYTLEERAAILAEARSRRAGEGTEIAATSN